MTVRPEVRDRVLQLRAEKKTVRDIAAELAIGKSTVSDILKATAKPVPDAAPTPLAEKSTPSEEAMPIPQLIISEEAASSFLSDIAPAQAPAPAPPPVAKGSGAETAFLAQFAASLKKKEDKEPEMPEEAPAPKSRRRAPKVRIPDNDVEEDEPKPRRAAPPPEPPMDKGHMIAKITALLTSFPGMFAAHIKDAPKFIDSLGGRSAADLKTQLELLESTRSIVNGSLVLHALFGTVAGGVEVLGGKFGLQTQGYQRLMLSQDGALREIFRDIAFENSNKLKAIQRPELRLAMLMCQTLMAVDTMNRRAPAAAPASGPVSEAPADTVAPETEEKFADL